MLLRTLAISALAICISSAAFAEGGHKRHTPEFKDSSVRAAIGGNVDHSKDAILPDGTINMDPSVVGSGRSGDFISRLQCDALPNTNEMRTNTYNVPLSGCP